MPNIRIIKLKIRRGSDTERKQVVLEQAELGYTIDTRRLFIGDGVTLGGEAIGAKVHSVLPSSNTRNFVSTAYQNDVVYENNFLYQLTGTDYSQLTAWSFIGTQANNSSIEYDSERRLKVKDNGITTAMIQPSAINLSKINAEIVSPLGGINFSSVSGLSANLNQTIFQVNSSNEITIKDKGITGSKIADDSISKDQINSDAISKGLIGGSGTALSARVDNDTVILNSSDEIAIGNVYGSNINLGPGMEAGAGDTLAHFIQRVNNVNLNVSDYRLDLTEKLIYNNRQYNSPNLVIDKAGLIRSVSNNICLPLSSNSPAYGGYAAQLSGNEVRTTVTATTGIDSGTFTLSSAGFMVVRIGTPNITTGDTRDFLNAQYVALPIFTIPESIVALVDGVETLIYPNTFFGYRAYDETETYNENSTNILTGAVCSGSNDFTGLVEELDIYTDSETLAIGSVIAASVNAIATDELPTLSGWWAIDNTLYFVDSTNTITQTGTC